MNTQLKVGLFVLIISGIFAYLTIAFNDRGFGQDTQDYYIYFNMVEGLSKGADVQVKGVKVGRVEDIVFKNSIVEVKVSIRKDVPLYKNAVAYIRTLGLMGDKYVYIDPGTPDAGKLPEKAIIRKGQVFTSAEEAFSSAADVAKKVEILVDNLNKAIEEGNLTELIRRIRVLAEHTDQLVQENRRDLRRTIENVRVITDNLRTHLPELIAKLDRITTHLEAITGDNRDDIRELVKNLKETSVALKEKTPKVLEDIDQAALQVRDTVGENREDIRSAVEKIKDASLKLDRILAKIDEGKGTIGKLVNEDDLYNNVNEGVKSFAKPFKVINRSKLDIKLYAETHTGNEDVKAGIAAIFSHRPDRYLYFGALSNTNGKVLKEEEYQTGSTVTTRLTRNYGILFDVQYAGKLFGEDYPSLWVRAGLKDSGAAGGFDIHFSENFKLKSDIYNFDRRFASGEPAHPQLDIVFQYKFGSSPIFIDLGGSDLLNDGVRGVFIGGGFLFNDNDLKYILGSVPKP
ncbi:MAG TPA: MCE family protein [Persephonella sp.]|uniref:Mce related protein n=1 Tax=Persephonella marina (strain DSM 14350 / EX-H1) TaxID=123214 RepID=C0QRE9_PERMH|nr:MULTISPECIES: MlaD family protein [Persephonella]ACO04908.1 mce related protein [Persephonella marina EX-H1]HCB68991.1 MCE family protein [Persephonella sp.]